MKLSDAVKHLPGDLDALANPVNSHALYKILRLNSAVALSLKSFFTPQLHFLFPHLPPLYSIASTLVKRATSQVGSQAAQHSSVRTLRLVRKQILILTTVR